MTSFLCMSILITKDDVIVSSSRFLSCSLALYLSLSFYNRERPMMTSSHTYDSQVFRASTDLLEKSKQAVAALLKLPGNKRCADCGEKGNASKESNKQTNFLLCNFFFFFCLDPSWASINIGIFVCINCSGKKLKRKKKQIS